MNINLHRLWAIVDTISGEVLYSSTQYTLSKKHYDYLCQLHNTDKSKWPKLFGGALGREFLRLFRYDLARHYIEPSFGNCLKAALIDSLPGSKSTSILDEHYDVNVDPE